MPTYQAAGISLRLLTLPLEHSTTSKPTLRPPAVDVADSSPTSRTARTLFSDPSAQALAEECLPLDNDGFRLGFLGSDASTPFLLVKAGTRRAAKKDTQKPIKNSTYRGSAVSRDMSMRLRSMASRTQSDSKVHLASNTAPKLSPVHLSAGDLEDPLSSLSVYSRPEEVKDSTKEEMCIALDVQLDPIKPFDRAFPNGTPSRSRRSDIKIEVFVNGEFTGSSLSIPRQSVRDQFCPIFAGHKIARLLEAALVYQRERPVSPRCRPSPAEIRERWESIAARLYRHAKLMGTHHNLQHSPSLACLESLSHLEIPESFFKSEDNFESNALAFGVMDVIITTGKGRKSGSEDGYAFGPAHLWGKTSDDADQQFQSELQDFYRSAGPADGVRALTSRKLAPLPLSRQRRNSSAPRKSRRLSSSPLRQEVLQEPDLLRRVQHGDYTYSQSLFQDIDPAQTPPTLKDPPGLSPLKRASCGAEDVNTQVELEEYQSQTFWQLARSWVPYVNLPSPQTPPTPATLDQDGADDGLEQDHLQSPAQQRAARQQEQAARWRFRGDLDKNDNDPPPAHDALALRIDTNSKAEIKSYDTVNRRQKKADQDSEQRPQLGLSYPGRNTLNANPATHTKAVNSQATSEEQTTKKRKRGRVASAVASEPGAYKGTRAARRRSLEASKARPLPALPDPEAQEQVHQLSRAGGSLQGQPKPQIPSEQARRGDTTIAASILGFAVPELCRRSALTYIADRSTVDETTGAPAHIHGVRQARAERNGQFEEQEVVLAVRYIVQ